ncbi:MAG: radical SAM protein [Thermoplasmata archaeon]
MSDFPKALQIEITNKCNFKCIYCIRKFWNITPKDMEFQSYHKLSENFKRLDKLILYGLGEPLVHPDFLKMLCLARDQLKDNGEICFSTNGSLLNNKIADKIVKEIGVNRISFSLDTIEHTKLENLRVGSKTSNIIKNLKYVSKIKKLSKVPLTLSLEMVILKDNFQDLPNLIKFAGENNIDSILVTNIITYSEIFEARYIYATINKKSYEISKEILNEGEKLIHDAVVESHSLSYIQTPSINSIRKYHELWVEVEKSGYWLNLPFLIKKMDEFAILNEVENIFKESLTIAKEYGVKLELPNLFADKKTRFCPYIKDDITVIRADGKIVPCMSFMYAHSEYVNFHVKRIKEVIFGDIKEKSLEEIWNDKSYTQFRLLRKFINENIPWCGDCVYSTLGCFYVNSNEIDCQRNNYSCSECLYSVGIAKCML